MSNKKKLGFLILMVIVFTALWFTTYMIESKRIDKVMASMENSVDMEDNEEEEKEIKSMKVVVGDKKYTTRQFMQLDSYPVTAQVIIVYDDATVETKNCYVSYNDEITDFTYKDGAYGRILLPSSLVSTGSGITVKGGN